MYWTDLSINTSDEFAYKDCHGIYVSHVIWEHGKYLILD